MPTSSPNRQGLVTKPSRSRNVAMFCSATSRSLHGGHFALLATGVDNLTLDNLLVDTERDGFDLDCCHNVRVSSCTGNSPSDDAICPKSSFVLGYARTTENVAIANCL